MKSWCKWTHCNAVNITPDGNLLVSFRQISTVGLVDCTSGKFRWKWGPGEISHQHYPTWLGNGRVLLFDNGSHRLRQGVTYSRVIKVDIETNEIVWAYCGDPPFSFYKSGH
jgi:Arylsulfotransferase (ASST)